MRLPKLQLPGCLGSTKDVLNQNQEEKVTKEKVNDTAKTALDNYSDGSSESGSIYSDLGLNINGIEVKFTLEDSWLPPNLIGFKNEAEFVKGEKKLEELKAANSGRDTTYRIKTAKDFDNPNDYTLYKISVDALIKLGCPVGE